MLNLKSHPLRKLLKRKKSSILAVLIGPPYVYHEGVFYLERMSFFPEIDEMLDRAININEVDAWRFVMDKDTQAEIIRLITQDQLFDKGIDGRGISLGEYTEFTKRIKRAKGQKVANVTLRDTGAFYNSFFIVVKDDSIEVWADDESLYDQPLTQVYGIDILTLTEDNEDFISRLLIPKYIEYVDRKILQ